MREDDVWESPVISEFSAPRKGSYMPLSLEESKYALSKILAVLMSPWQSALNYDNLKAAADRHQKRIDELEAAQKSV